MVLPNMSNEDMVLVMRRVGRRGKGGSKTSNRGNGNSAGDNSAGRGLRDEIDGEEVPANNGPGIEGGEEQYLVKIGTGIESGEEQYLVKMHLRNARGVSDGQYENKPQPGEPKLGTVYFLDKHIRSHPQMKTLKAVMQANWPTTRLDVKVGIVARREFIDKCVKNFSEYYDYPQEMTEEEGDRLVEIHITSNIRQNMFDDRNRADQKVKKYPGTTRRDFVPKHLDRLAWEALCDYWGTTDFMNRSETNKGNRQHKKLKHTTGSTALAIFQENMEKKEGRPLELFEMSHSKKNVVDETDKLPEEARRFKVFDFDIIFT